MECGWNYKSCVNAEDVKVNRSNAGSGYVCLEPKDRAVAVQLLSIIVKFLLLITNAQQQLRVSESVVP